MRSKKPSKQPAKTPQNIGASSHKVVETIKACCLLLRSVSENGLWTVKCPFCGRSYPPAFYQEPDETSAYGKFTCSFCPEKTTFDFFRVINVDPLDAIIKPKVEILEGAEEELLNQVEKILSKNNVYLFNGKYFLINKGKERVILTELNQQDFISLVDHLIAFIKFDKRLLRLKLANAPERTLARLFSSRLHKYIREIKKVVYQPFVDKTGEIVNSYGYIEGSKTFCAFNPKDFEIPEIGADELSEAIAKLEGLLEEVPFKSDEDKALAITLILTALQRPVLESAPLFLVTADDSGAGKSYFCESIALFTSKEEVKALVYPKNDEEMAKFLVSTLIKRPRTVFFDNITSNIDPSPALCTALTQRHLSQRKLGSNTENIEVDTQSLFLVNGNNVEPRKDMIRRTAIIVLNSGVYMPNSQPVIRVNLREEMRKNRCQWVSLGLAIVRAWIISKQRVDTWPRIPGYDEWQDTCVAPLWLYRQVNPLARTLKLLQKGERDSPDLQILNFIERTFGEQAFSTADLCQAVKNAKLNDLSLFGKFIEEDKYGHKRINHKKCGWHLSRLTKQRPIAGKSLISAPKISPKSPPRYRLIH